MDLSEHPDAIEQICFPDVEVLQETVDSAAECSDSDLTPAPASSETSLQLEMTSVPFEHSHETSNAGNGETPDELISFVSISEPPAADVDNDQLEVILQPEQTDNEEPSEFGTTVCEDDSHHIFPPFDERLEHNDEGNESVQQATEEESVGIRDSGEESQQLSCELGSRSQTPMSFVVQLNEDSECSLQSLPAGEHGPTNFSMSGLVRADESYISAVGRVTAEYLEDDSRGSQLSERITDEPDLMMEVETGSTMSEAVSVKDSSTTLHPTSTKTASTSARKSSSRMDDKSKSRIRKRLMMETAPAETEDGLEEMVHVFEYQWPLNDKSAEWFLLQEHISEFLGVVSFKRKYPDIYRRAVDIHERQFLQDSKVVTEMQCDLGLTVLKADEVYDIMERDYPDKFKEYSSIINKRQQRQKEFDQQKSVEPPTEKTKLETLIAKSVRSAADFNASLMRELRQERRAYFDLQTSELHYPQGRMKVRSAEDTKIGRYPLAVIPGQFQDYYRSYTPAELRHLPINTVMIERQNEMKENNTAIEQTEDTAAVDAVDEAAESVPGSVADDDNKNTQSEEPAAAASAEVSHSTSVADEPTESQITDTVTVDPELVAATTAKVRCLLKRKQAAEAEVEKVKCVVCGQSDKNKLNEDEDMICCAVCSSSGHPSCLELTQEMIPIIKTYDWQCMECKACVKCMKPHDEERMMFCDHCDRGYHTFCVGLKVIPAGRWECPSCAPASAAPPKPKRGRPFKYPRPVIQPSSTASSQAPAQQ